MAMEPGIPGVGEEEAEPEIPGVGEEEDEADDDVGLTQDEAVVEQPPAAPEVENNEDGRYNLHGGHNHNYDHPYMTEFRQSLQVQSHLEMSGILVQLGHIQRT